MSMLNLSAVLGENTDTYQDIIRDANIMLSDESLTTPIRHVLDLFIRTGNVLKVTLFRFNQALKRGELEKYCNDHALIVREVENANFFDIQAVTAAVPFGMKGDYKTAIDVLNTALTDLGMVDVLDAAVTAFRRVVHRTANNEDVSQDIATLKETLSLKDKTFKENFAKVHAIFTSFSQPNAQFRTKFASMADFKDCRIAELETEKHLFTVDKVDSLYKELVLLAQDIVSVKETVVAQDVRNQLAESAMSIARMLDFFGECCQNIMAVSHNLVINIGTIYNEI